VTRVLLVDDHEVVRCGLREILLESFPGARIGEASDATAALELLAREQWDVALIDLTLPGRDGLFVLEAVVRSRPRLPALVLSVHPEEEFAVRCLQLGAAGYLTKDSAAEEMTAAVNKALSGGRYISASLAERLAGLVAGDVALPSHQALSARELEVLRLVAGGFSLKRIAARLDLSQKTIATYRARITVKLDLSTNIELTRYAMRHKLVE
jgi:DNA-binding NarL/FixJ family response regulator